ncbi:MAG: PASTA domain-containing protein [Alkalispirochaeta sp.]
MNVFGFLRRKQRTHDDNPEQRYARITAWTFIGLFLLFSLGGVVAFLLALEGPDQTQVPDLREEELADAVILLQERGLYPELQLRFHSDPAMRGRVLSQDPEPGSVVRSGRRIAVLVSQGAVVDEVGEYQGLPLQEVQAEIQSLGAGSEGVLYIDSVSYVFDDASSGTVIAQEPAAGTSISGSTGVDLVVSRGPEVEQVSLPTFVGLSWEDALQILARDDIPFQFELEEQPTTGQEGVIVDQRPDPGEQVELGTPAVLTMRNVRSVPSGEVFGIFDRTLPEYAVAVELSAVAVGPEGESSTIFNMIHPGGRLAFPYQVAEGSTIIIYRYDTEVIRYVVSDSSESE